MCYKKALQYPCFVVVTSAQVVGLLSFSNFTQPTIGFGNLDQSLTKRGFGRVGKAQKHVLQLAESAASKGGGLGVFIALLEKLAIF